MSEPSQTSVRGSQLHALRTFTSSLVPVFFALGVQLVGFVAMAKFLGPSAFGELTVIVSIAAIAIELTGLGAGDLLIRGVAKRPDTFPNYYGNAIILGAATAVISIALSIVVAKILVPSLAVATTTVLIVSEVLVGRISAFGEQAAISHHNVVRASFYRSIAAVVRLLFISTAVSVLPHFSLDSWSWLAAGNALIVSTIIATDVTRIYGRPLLWIAKKELMDGCYFAMNQTGRASQSNLDRLFLAQTASPAVLGNYGAAARLVQVGLVPLQIITRMYYPKFFKHSEKGPSAVRSYAIRSAVPMFVVAVLSAAIISLGATFIPSLLGSGYSDSVNSTIALAWTLPLVGLQYPAADGLTVMSLQGLRTAIYLTSVLCSSGLLAIAAYLGGVGTIIAAVYLANAVVVILLWILMLMHTRVPAVVVAD